MSTSAEKRKRPGPTKQSDHRTVYLLRLQAGPRVDPVRALRRGLKMLFRHCGLRCLSVREEQQ
jgi:hypothetical protein